MRKSIGSYDSNSSSKISQNLKRIKNIDIIEPLVEPQETKIEHGQYTYTRPIEYWLMIIGFAIGYGSFWRFPYLVYSCGYVFFINILIEVVYFLFHF